ncbi:Ribosomal large subunit pseudouridine synthase D [Candidatus Arsenophonus lipoptenae]|uniref:Pseudouridine synthase n=1 Tax=Candidatus Arsenophonus lipoptenae TaxID=634113 RepID=A0A120HPS0_9GAMM|nr:23S rRNA pseudouridine(1911/1915/1917) synthase RluD [Candidatus Arsenophonus lipoptenae]AMA64605.1 Ribosomal large subunit pseudouridine synthase D [Candidatus Arsenophonus lipoptenae]
MDQQLKLKSKILKSQLGTRLDKVLAELFPNYSRSQIKKWILDDRVKLNDKIINIPKKKVFGNEQIDINILIKEEISWRPQNIPLNIVYEDDEILVINKSSNLVVHPGYGNPQGTILNAILYHYPKNINIPRAGIIHRLDKDTTGLMVIVKTINAQRYLLEAFKTKKIIREYEALVNGCITINGKIDKPIARHPTKRTHMIIHHTGKPAITHYKVIENFQYYTRLKLRLESGRTHQIRVHMAYINHPLIGDPVYGRRLNKSKYISKKLNYIISQFNRQALHAKMLSLYHPSTGIKMEWCIDLPEDMITLINVLKYNV